MSVKGFQVGGAIERYDYNALENLPNTTGLSDDIKAALLQIAENVAYKNTSGSSYYQDLYNALYAEPQVVLDSITAVYTQTGPVYDSDSLDSLRSGLLVTANYDDGASQTVTAYTLSGALTVGTSTITVIYQNVSTTFTVAVTATPTAYSITLVLSECTISNTASTVYEGDAYQATLSCAADYTLTTVGITMGGADVTGTVYANGNISISSVTGDIVITAVATQRVSSLDSIEAVFTQGSAIIYDTDSLDALKQYLVVTAYWSDSTSSVVSADDYTLSGTLAVGTSTITVSYGGKSDTFTVTVSVDDRPVYSFETGEYVSGVRTITVSDGNHFEYTDGRTDSYSSYVNLSKVTANSSVMRLVGNINNKSKFFTIPAGSTIRLEVKNITATRKQSGDTIDVGLRDTGTTVILSTGDFSTTSTGDKSVELQIESDTNVGCFYLFGNKNLASISADVYFYVDGVRWI